MLNFLKETEARLKEHRKSPSDVLFIVSRNTSYNKDHETYLGNWEDFKNLANFSYDNGYGGNRINLNLKIVGKDWWLERREYDGSEWWEFKTIPTKPIIPLPFCLAAIEENS